MAALWHSLKVYSRVVLACAMIVTLAGAGARATELIVFEQAACPWCLAFDKEVGVTYNKTEEGRRAPLRRVDIFGPLPADLSFVQVERFTPVFVLVDNGREIGRIRGYGGRESFWMQLYKLMQKLEPSRPEGERTLRTDQRAYARG